MKPEVSVIIIFYNAEQFLQEAVESVLAQTYGGWELLLVDDGSNDGSTAIAKSYVAKHSGKARYVQHAERANRGMSASRNLGIHNARGAYLAFLDADDVWRPTTLEQQVSILQDHPRAAMVYGPLEWWYSWDGASVEAQDYIEELGVPEDHLVEPPTLVTRFLQNRATVPSGIMVRRAAIEQVGGFVDAFRGEYEDQVFCAKICLTYPVFVSGNCWYRYRQHTDSSVMTGARSGRTHRARKLFLNWLGRYLLQQRVRHWSVWRALLEEQLRLRNRRLYDGLFRGDAYARQGRTKIADAVNGRVGTA